jgi:endonuclease YncB( thermonuclease family)
MNALPRSRPQDRRPGQTVADLTRRRHRRSRVAALLLAAALVAPVAQPVSAGTVIEAARVTVIDGDTLDVGAVRVRLLGVDAPELGQRCASGRGDGAWTCGARAAERLSALVDGAPVSCDPMGRDGYGRTLAVCRVRGEDIGEALVREGLAWAFRRYSDNYAPAEDAARRARHGVWRAETMPPWAYREQRWTGAAGRAPRPGCPIKGNITAQGERVYHTPWSPWYERTTVDERRGERWFCDEAEAATAGWRAARFR